ncbi:MAG: BrnA antitoxin family protein [Alphaproteobacteria bacterium]
MSGKHMTTVSVDDLADMPDRTRENAPEGETLGADFWKTAKVVFPDGPKERLTVRFDRDVVAWFKSQGRGYQTRMNAVLRSYYEAHESERNER